MFRFWRDLNFIKIISIVVAVVLIYSFFLSKFGIFEITKLKSIDFFYKISRLIKPQHENIDKIVIISIDERSFKVLKKRWPWERTMFATLIDKLQRYKPKLICFDFSFVGESKNKEDDLLFAESIKNSGNVIIASHFDPGGEYVIPEKIFTDGALGYGFLNKPRDRDYYVRRARMLHFSKNRRTVDLSFETKTICKYFDIGLSEILYNPENNDIRITKQQQGQDYISFTLREDGTIPINYQAKFHEFKTIPFWKILKKDLPEDTFKDKIILVSLTSEIFHDIYNTPIGVLPGVVIIANELLMFLNNNFIKEIPLKANLLILLFFVLITTFVVYRAGAFKGFLFSIIAIALFIGISLYLSLQNYWADYFSVISFIGITYLGIGTHKYIQLILESAHLKTLAITDGLTELFVYRYFQIRFQNEFSRAIRYNLNLSLIIMDIDHFKDVNDTYGHQQGNSILKSLADILRKMSRKADVLVRYGGEEFCIILPHTNQEGTLIYAERLRKIVENFNFRLINSNKTIKITISLGTVTFPKVKTESVEELIKFADMALYEAKKSGRNKVCVAELSFTSKKQNELN